MDAFNILIVIICICAFCFWIFILIECATKERDMGDRIVWVLIILFLNALGALLYYFFRRDQREVGELDLPDYTPWKED